MGKRIIRISREKSGATLSEAPEEITMGKGEDASVIRNRTPSNPTPMTVAAPLAIILHPAEMKVDYTSFPYWRSSTGPEPMRTPIRPWGLGSEGSR